MLMDEKKAELLDKILQHLKEKRREGFLPSIGDILPELNYDEQIVLNTTLVRDGYLKPGRVNDAKVGGMITDEGIAFITEGGYLSQTQLKKFQDINIFISYSSEDKAHAEELAKILKEVGVKYFLDSKDVNWGDNIQASIDSALSECTDLVVIISKTSLQSEWVKYEIISAHALKKKILPYLTQSSLFDSLPPYLKEFHCKTRPQEVKSYFESRKREDKSK